MERERIYAEDLAKEDLTSFEAWSLACLIVRNQIEDQKNRELDYIGVQLKSLMLAFDKKEFYEQT